MSLGRTEFPGVRVWDPNTGSCLRILETQHGGRVLSVTPDGSRAVLCDFQGLHVYDLETGACLRTLEVVGDMEPMTLDGRRSERIEHLAPDGQRVVLSGGNTLRVWDLRTGACLQELEVPGTIERVTPAGRWVVFSEGNALHLWDPETDACILTLEGPTVCCMSITTDGRRAVSGHFDNSLRVWNLATGMCLRTLEGHAGRVLSVTMAPSGLRAVSGSSDRTLRVWDLNSGVCDAILHLPSPAQSVAFSSSLNRVIVGTSTGEVAIYEVSGTDREVL